MDYHSFRHFADSWGLLYLLVIFVGVILYVFRPGSKKVADESARIPFKEDNENV